MEFSNKNLALVLVVAIVVSLGGTIMSLNKLSQVSTAPARLEAATGRASAPAGYVNVTIDSNASCGIDKNVMFGTGKPTTTRVLSTDANNNFDGWTCDGTDVGGACSGLPINNTGNVYLNISYNSTKNGSGMLGSGHTEADFVWAADDLEANSAAACIYTKSISTNVNVSGGNNNSVICSYLNFTDDRDTVVMEFNITINENTVPEVKTATITIGCVDATSGA